MTNRICSVYLRDNVGSKQKVLSNKIALIFFLYKTLCKSNLKAILADLLISA